MTRIIFFTLITTAITMAACNPSKKAASPVVSDKPVIQNLLSQYPHWFDTLLSNKEEYRVQIIYTEIDRTENRNVFTDYYYNVDPTQYFYPASTVKLPVALLALQKLNELKISGLDMNSTMITEDAYSGQTSVHNDPTAEDGRPSIAHYIKKILLVSDNDAYNRLYEFLGQEYINNELHKMGYTNAQIIHRLEISMTEDQNRHCNPVKFFDTAGTLLYEKPLEKSKLTYITRDQKLGVGFMRSGKIVNEPFDFSKKNQLALPDLHNILRSALFPESVNEKQRFNLTESDYAFVREYLSKTPPQSTNPIYDMQEYGDNYVKFLYYGTEKTPREDSILIYNKVGDAYGFLIDAAYIKDTKHDKDFMLSATIHCNRDRIYNDGKYEYATIGFPFMKHLGRAFHTYRISQMK